MKAFVTSVGETTTNICCQQLKKLGFQVYLTDELESWPSKYKRFINWALKFSEDVLRVDADIIVNKNIKYAEKLQKSDYKMVQFTCFDYYKNDLSNTCPVWYSKEALEIIDKHWNELDLRRPEASAWRLPKIVEYTYTNDLIVGSHGLYPSNTQIKRAIKNKTERKQIDDFDFELVNDLRRIYEKN